MEKNINKKDGDHNNVVLYQKQQSNGQSYNGIFLYLKIELIQIYNKHMYVHKKHFS